MSRKQAKRARFGHRAAISRRYARGLNRWLSALYQPGRMRFNVSHPNTIFLHPDSRPMLVDPRGCWRRLECTEDGFKWQSVNWDEVCK